MMDWAEKYRPQRLGEIVGNGPAIRRIAEWAREWSRKSKPLLLYGKPGIGKTSAALAIAREMNWEVVELNASDQRTKAMIERIAGAGSTTASLTGATRKLIMLDEADNLHGNADRGGARAIIDLIKNSRQPIILIANDLYGIPRELRARCETVQFKAIPARSIAPHLRFICSSEQISCDNGTLRTMGEDAAGDVRAAVNMLYAASIGSREIDGSVVSTASKDERKTIFDLIAAIFKGRNDEVLTRMSLEVNEQPDTVIQWIEENLPLIKRPHDRAAAYAYLSASDRFLGLTFRRQYHTLWRYATALMLIGTATAAADTSLHSRISPPSRWQAMGAGKRQKEIRNALFNRLGRMLHMGVQTVREEYLAMIATMVEAEPAMAIRELGLDEDELVIFLHDKDLAKETMKSVNNNDQEATSPIPAGTEEGVETDALSKKKEKNLNQSTLFDGF